MPDSPSGPVEAYAHRFLDEYVVALSAGFLPSRPGLSRADASPVAGPGAAAPREPADSVSSCALMVGILVGVVLEAGAALGEGPEGVCGAATVCVVGELRARIGREVASAREIVSRRSEQMYDRFRRRLARDLHDDIGNTLSLAARNIELAQLHRDRGDGDAAEARIVAARDVLHAGVASIGEVVGDLTADPDRESPGLVEGLYDAAARYRLEIDLHVRGDLDRLDGRQRSELFLVLREALRNVAAHAEVSRAAVAVTVEPDGVDATVTDRGRGLRAARVAASGGRAIGGHGMRIMRERAQGLGGDLECRSGAGGTTVRVGFPLGAFAGASSAARRSA